MLAVPRKKTLPREAKEQGDRFATVNRNILRVELRSLLLPQLVMPIFGFVPLLPLLALLTTCLVVRLPLMASNIS